MKMGDAKECYCVQLGNLTDGAKRDNPNRRRVYSIDGLCPTLTQAMGAGGNLQPFIIIKQEDCENGR